METMTANKNCVLDKETIQRKIKRMALEVAERNTDEQEIIIAGINGNGEVVANAIATELEKLSLFRIETISIQLNKKDPLQVSVIPEINLSDKTILLVDDVANTGKTMLYAMKPFIETHPKKIQTLVLVERSHKLFPVQTDYAGLSIATTLQEHITVETEASSIAGAYLH
jgi:pyrimidine operon attenuation protein / uracil phosphoribosyltransferase